MTVLCVNRILKSVQISSGGRRYTCPTKEINGELFSGSGMSGTRYWILHQNSLLNLKND